MCEIPLNDVRCVAALAQGIRVLVVTLSIAHGVAAVGWMYSARTEYRVGRPRPLPTQPRAGLFAAVRQSQFAALVLAF